MIDPENFPVRSQSPLSGKGTFCLGLFYQERRESGDGSASIVRVPLTNYSENRLNAGFLFDEFIKLLQDNRDDYIAAIQRYIDHGPA